MRTSFTGSPLEEPVYEAPPKRDVVPVIEELLHGRHSVHEFPVRKITTVLANENSVLIHTGQRFTILTILATHVTSTLSSVFQN
tara:strand:+ start:595 stop:846 length:252 start_codon:yes stop_codon:yes gene_type:complete